MNSLPSTNGDLKDDKGLPKQNPTLWNSKSSKVDLTMTDWVRFSRKSSTCFLFSLGIVVGLIISAAPIKSCSQQVYNKQSLMPSSSSYLPASSKIQALNSKECERILSQYRDHSLLQFYDLPKLLHIDLYGFPPPAFKIDTVQSTNRYSNDYYIDDYGSLKHQVPESLKLAAACKWPRSIWARYHLLPPLCPTSSVPKNTTSRNMIYPEYVSVPRLRQAIREYGTSLPSSHELIPLYNEISKSNPLIVQLDLSYPTLSHSFLDEFSNHLSSTSSVIFICSNNTQKLSISAIEDTHDHFKLLRSKMDNIYVQYKIFDLKQTRNSEDYDSFIYLFSLTHNLLIHTNIHSVLASIAVSSPGGVVYHVNELMKPYIDNHEYKWNAVMDMRDLSRESSGRTPSIYLQQWRQLAKVESDSCCNIEHFGRGDGEKYICTNSKSLSLPSSNMNASEKECWILSIGCGGLFDFERLMVKRYSHCKIHLFDCTNNFVIPRDLKSHVTFHKLCIGSSTSAKLRESSLYKPLNEMIEIGSASFNSRDSKKVIMPSLFKFDAEGAEFPVLTEMLENTADNMLPTQMIIEFHLRMYHKIDMFRRQNSEYIVPYTTARTLLDKLRQRGYRIVYRADNPGDDACTELTLVLKDNLPSMIGHTI